MQEQVIEQVREHYGSIAREVLEKGSASCCGDIQANCCAPADTIPVQALAALRDDAPLPDEIIRTSLGCGTPLEMARLQPGETVLDLGSGGGLDCFYAAKLVGPLGHVIGVDMTQDMLELANRNKEKAGLHNVEFRRGYLESLPVDDDSVDVVISNCVINLATEKDRVFAEAFRVLKPGGRVAFSDEVARHEIPAGLRKNMESWAACVAGAIPAAEYSSKMEQAGFQNVAVTGDSSPGGIVYSAKFTGFKPTV